MGSQQSVSDVTHTTGDLATDTHSPRSDETGDSDETESNFFEASRSEVLQEPIITPPREYAGLPLDLTGLESSPTLFLTGSIRNASTAERARLDKIKQVQRQRSSGSRNLQPRHRIPQAPESDHNIPPIPETPTNASVSDGAPSTLFLQGSIRNSSLHDRMQAGLPPVPTRQTSHHQRDQSRAHLMPPSGPKGHSRVPFEAPSTASERLVGALRDYDQRYARSRSKGSAAKRGGSNTLSNV